MQKLRGVLPIILIITLLSSIVLAQTNSSNITGIREKIDSKVDKQITLPTQLEKISKIILGIENPIKLSVLIIVLGLWLVIFIILGQTCKLIPFLENGVIPWIAALIIMLLMAVSGGLNKVAMFILSMTEAFKFLNDWSIFAIIVAIIGLIVITVIVVRLEKYIKQKADKTKAQVQGMQIGNNLGFLSRMKEFMGFK